MSSCTAARQSFGDPLGRRFLKRLNGHSRDKHITFEAGDHAYFWKGERVTRSVTQLVHEFKNEFSEDHVISSMQTSTNWPRPGYLKSTLSEHQKAVLAGLKDTEQLLMKFQRKERDEPRICKLAHQLRARAPKNKAIAEMVTGLGLSEAEIQEKWAKARDDGAKEGTWMHAQFECLLNGGSLPCQTAEVVLLARFLRSQRDTIAYRTEWQVYADDEDIAGSIDYVAERPDGSKVIVDWKRTRRARLSDEAFGKLMQGPLRGVPDCTLWHYRLQLNVYRFILEKYYGLTVSCMYIVGTNPDNGDQPYVDEVPRLKSKARDRCPHATLDDPQASRNIKTGQAMMKCRQAQLLTVSVFQCRHLRRAEPARAPEFSICQHLANASFKSIIQHQPQGTEVHCASDQPTTEPPHASFRTRAPSRLGRTAARSTDPVAPWHLQRMRRECAAVGRRAAQSCTGATASAPGRSRELSHNTDFATRAAGPQHKPCSLATRNPLGCYTAPSTSVTSTQRDTRSGLAAIFKRLPV